MDKTNLKLAVLDNAKDFLCLILDEGQNIVFPETPEELSKFKEIDASPTPIDGVYHLESSQEWYEKEEKKVQVDGHVYRFIYYRDITKFKVLEQVLQNDYITGIANRAAAIEEINEYIKYAIANDEEFSVLISDVDYFKSINDTYGHFFGDIVLKDIGTLIKRNLRLTPDREEDIAGRFGGDEFFGLIKNISQEETEMWVKRADKTVKDLIHESMDKSTKISGVSMSIGMFHVSHEVIASIRSMMPLSIEEIRKNLYKKCDDNLYDVKKAKYAQKNAEEQAKIDGEEQVSIESQKLL